jgi:protein tyrosine phosphatase (PTP) superfamily phosphohydrolase (DUF442 family)
VKEEQGQGQGANPGFFRRLVTPGGLVLLCLAATFCNWRSHLVYVYNPLNFHVVKEGVLYRSGQPGGDDLERIAREHGIRSVINLRGANPGEPWYEEEIAASRRLGLERVEISMSAERLPHREELSALLDAFRELPRPMLVHCDGGADRSGEAVAIFALEHLKWSRSEALLQLRPSYGHNPERYPAKTYFVERVWRGGKWAREAYYPCRLPLDYYDRAKYCGGP